MYRNRNFRGWKLASHSALQLAGTHHKDSHEQRKRKKLRCFFESGLHLLPEIPQLITLIIKHN